MASLSFDASTVDPQQSFEPIPADWYNVMITESELKPTKNNDGAYLSLTLKVIDGQYAGRMVFDRLNIQNKNPVAVEIAYKMLSAYCHATGVIQVQDSQQLHGIPFKARVVVKTDSSGQYDPSNEIKAVKHINEQVGTVAAPQTQPQQAGYQGPGAAQPAAQQHAFVQPAAAPGAQAFNTAPQNAVPQTQQLSPAQFQQQQQQQFQQPAQQAPVQQQQQFQQPPQQQQAPVQQQGGTPVPPWVTNQ